MTDRHVFYIIDKRDGTGPLLCVLEPRGGHFQQFPIDTLAMTRLVKECAALINESIEPKPLYRLDPVPHGADSEC